MNCVKLQFPNVDISISANYYYRNSSPNPNFYEEWQFNGTFSITQQWAMSRKLKYALAKNCTSKVPYIVLQDRNNWQPYLEGPLCTRFNVKTLSINGVGQFLGIDPIVGYYTLSLGPGNILTSEYLFYIIPAEMGTSQQENWWQIDNLRPWDAADPFFGRNLSMWDAKPTSFKETSAIIYGGFVDPETGEFTTYFTSTLTFAKNADSEQADIVGPFGDTSGSATLTINIQRA